MTIGKILHQSITSHMKISNISDDRKIVHIIAFHHFDAFSTQSSAASLLSSCVGIPMTQLCFSNKKQLFLFSFFKSTKIKLLKNMTKKQGFQYFISCPLKVLFVCFCNLDSFFIKMLKGYVITLASVIPSFRLKS